ncbi:hypothetical protein V0288_03445 [Pannus brasiliensis CCIBt3594]|uniref:Uncharacterized protein n=1 Tax=Pannus brasiliensis CCIBt3594 TaxID=1427578 RepID=A0AAW9QS78_9CHRO
MSPEKPDPETPENPLPSFKSFLSGQNTPAMIAHAIVSGCLVGATIILAAGLYYLGAKPIGDRWSKPAERSLEENTNNLESNLNSYLKKYSNIEIEKHRIKEQLSYILTKQEQNKTIAVDYYNWLFVVLPLTSSAAIVSGISLFYISKEGWKEANSYMINVFITSSTIALLNGSMSVVFKMQENATRHTEAFVTYENLYQQILTRLATLSPPSESQKLTIAQQLQTLITDNNNLLSTYNKLLINFDSSKIQLPNFLLPNSPPNEGASESQSQEGQ